MCSGERSSVGIWWRKARRLWRRRSADQYDQESWDVRRHALLDGARSHQADLIRHQGFIISFIKSKPVTIAKALTVNFLKIKD